jgi:hypothetical protein
MKESPLQFIADAARIVGDADALVHIMRHIQMHKPKLRRGSKCMIDMSDPENATSFKTYGRFIIEILIPGKGWLPLKIGNRIFYENPADRDAVLRAIKP